MTSIETGRAETRTITLTAKPDRVFDYLSDARHLPEWAPGFAPAVEHEHGDVWRIPDETGPRRVAVKVAKDHGVVDFVSADAPNLGLFARVVPNLTGAELIFSLFFPAGTDPAAVDAQMTVVDQELKTVRERVEA
ncbi:SRPBCC family protein [Amycolatopsis sp. NBRC 101858]|uniref:SRPBCC family protein n=1 Tax=Amycolatopsis sp. NBRC 101858 TaxID=3032200 RepID=UPI0025537CAB|nr:SRPBCC family protein [Amycolatopsis sp. NBRC 101858]